LKGGTEVRHSGSRALDILKERYARREINKEEFEEKKDAWVIEMTMMESCSVATGEFISFRTDPEN
jgi:hypothetical protein